MKSDCMKESTRGYIEMSIDEMIEDEKFIKDLMDDVAFFKEDIPITSLKDLALGYTFGVFLSFSAAILQIREGSSGKVKADEKETRTMIRRRLPEILKALECELNK